METQLKALDEILAGLKHLDLTGSVEYDDPKTSVAQGGFGEVYKGRCRRRSDDSETAVAIKCLTVYLDGKRDVTKIFSREIKAWCRLHHPNILPLLGYAIDTTKDQALTVPSLISEWMDNGNILEFVGRNSSANLVELVLGMAKGLTYLHEQNIVHSDFKAANVLVSAAGEAVICDFGSAHVSHDVDSGVASSNVSGLRGTCRWWAYELIANADLYPRATKQSDTWAFGTTVYEVISNGYPFPDLRSDAQVLISIMKQKLPSFPPTLDRTFKREELWKLCTTCWECDPVQRPTMSIIVDRLIHFSVEEQAIVKELVFFLHRSPTPEPKDFRFFPKSLHIELSRLRLPSQALEFSAQAFKHDDLGEYTLGQYAGNRVIVMRVNGDRMKNNREIRQILTNGVEIMLAMKQHSNVQTLLGYTIESRTNSAVLVFSHGGDEDVLTYVKTHPHCNIEEMTLGVAEGLAHIHNHDIVHADIRASGIFVNDHGQPVISGFTCARKLPFDQQQWDVQGSLRWMAPELMDMENDLSVIITKERDVWAFGMTINELLSGDVPYADLKYDPQVVLAIADGQLPMCPSGFKAWTLSRQAIWSVCLTCWNRDPMVRPPIGKLVGSLKGLISLQKAMA